MEMEFAQTYPIAPFLLYGPTYYSLKKEKIKLIFRNRKDLP